MKNTARTTVREGRQSSDNTYARIAAAEQNFNIRHRLIRNCIAPVKGCLSQWRCKTTMRVEVQRLVYFQNENDCKY